MADICSIERSDGKFFLLLLLLLFPSHISSCFCSVSAFCSISVSSPLFPSSIFYILFISPFSFPLLKYMPNQWQWRTDGGGGANIVSCLYFFAKLHIFSVLGMSFSGGFWVHCVNMYCKIKNSTYNGMKMQNFPMLGRI